MATISISATKSVLRWINARDGDANFLTNAGKKNVGRHRQGAAMAKIQSFFLRTVPLLLIVLAVFLPAQQAWAQAAMEKEVYQGNEVVAHEVLVKFKVAVAKESGLATAEQAQQSEEQSMREITSKHSISEHRGVGGISWYLLHSRTENVQQLIESISKRPDVEYVEPNFIIRSDIPHEPNDTYYIVPYQYQWSLKNVGQTIGGSTGTIGADIKAYRVWVDLMTTGTRASVVAITDNGVDYGHPDLAANVWSTLSEFPVSIPGQQLRCPVGSHGFRTINGSLSCDPIYEPPVGNSEYHGTYVAGVIGAVGDNGIGITGVNWQTSMLLSKWENQNGQGNVTDAINAIDLAIQAKTAGVANVRVINASWETSAFSGPLLDEIRWADTNNILFVASAGNNGGNNDQAAIYPASYGAENGYCDTSGGQHPNCFAQNVISVANSNNQDQIYVTSNYGANSVHLAAPGTSITSTVPRFIPGPVNGYCTPQSLFGECQGGSGTSAAAPHVSGTAMLVLSRCADLTRLQLKSNLLDLNNLDLVNLGRPTIKGGRLNAFKAVSSCGYSINAQVSPSGTGTVTSNLQGTVAGSLTTLSCAPTCSAVFKSSNYGGQTVMLSATPMSGYSFLNWSGDCSGSTCSILSTNVDKNATANFGPILTVVISPGGTGTVTGPNISCAPTCQASYPVGTQVPLTATSNTGYSFTGWSGGGCSGTGSCTVTMNSPQTVTANFQPILTVVVSPNGKGLVTGNGFNCTGTCSANFAVGTQLSLTASAIPGGYYFPSSSGWAGCDPPLGNPCMLTLNAPRTVFATFQPNTLTVNITGDGNGAGFVTSNPAGILCGLPGCSANFDVGTTVALTPRGDLGHALGSWSTAWPGSTCSGTVTPCSGVLNSPQSVTANFTAANITVTAPTSGQTFNANSPLTINWTTSTNIAGDTFRIDLLRGGQINTSIVTSVAASVGTYTWPAITPGKLGTDYQVLISDLNNPVVGTSAAFTITNSGPDIALTSVNTGIVPRGTRVRISWTFTGSPGTVRIDLLKPGTLPQNIAPAGTPIGPGFFDWDVLSTQQIGSGYAIQITTSGGASDTSHNFLIIR